MQINDSVKKIKGVGEKKEKLLKNLNIESISDLIFYMPRSYEDRTEIVKISKIDKEGSYLVRGIVTRIIKGGRFNRGKTVLKVFISDGTGELEAVFFNANYISSSIKVGAEYLFYGRVKGKQMVFPEFSQTEMGIIPIYPLTKGLSQKEIRKLIKTALEELGEIEEKLPAKVFEINNLCSLDYAIRNTHFPENKETLKAAKYRMIFEELLAMQLGTSLMRNLDYKGKEGIVLRASQKNFIEGLPFKLTSAQAKVALEIEADLESNRPMNRLLQGDVGSGKTVVAEIGIYKTYKSGHQSAMMVPTEVLARQHFSSMSESLKAYGLKIKLLTGSTTKKEKKQIIEDLAKGEIDLIIGTHALIEEDIKFKSLGLAITDEQHRFGVAQRAVLAEKGKGGIYPNILVMTATPIPRTIGVILYGDLDISIIDSLPKNRKSIITKKIQSGDRIKAYNFLKEQIEKGRQGYIVAPLIEDSEVIEARSAESIFLEFEDEFKGVCSNGRIALLHGAMKDYEKNQIMEEFKNGEIQVLVSTVVIEVGINVPNATVMIIESSHRFGLSQLHQLRGRVGRGSHQSYCMLIYDKSTKISKERLDVMVESTDGFYIAEKDMELRGAGDIFGTRQSGFVLNRFIELARNTKILEKAQKTCEIILSADKMLEKKENRYLKERTEKIFGETMSFFGKL